MFHRPHPLEDPADHLATTETGLGLSPRAQHIIQSLRLATDEFDLVRTELRNDLLNDHAENEAYLLAEPGRRYAAYFPDGGSVTLDLSDAEGSFTLRWISLDESEWTSGGNVTAGGDVELIAPSGGHWIAVLNAAEA